MSVELGTLNAKVALDLSGLILGGRAAKGEFKALAAELAASSQALAQKIKSDAEKAGAAQVAAMQKARLQLAGQISHGMLMAGTALAAGLAMGVKSGADLEKKLTEVAANTNMTDAAMKQMTQTIKDIGSKTSAPLHDLADGYMHITNFGFKAAEATKILNAAMHSAVSTGAQTASTANILSAVLHGFGISAEKAGQAMNVLHTAAAMGNMTLEEFNQAAGPTLAFAAALGVNLTDVASAMAALTRHGFNASEAATQVRNALAHIIQHSTGAKHALEALSKASGIDLVKEFSVAGLEARGLENAIKDLQMAAQKAGVNGPEAINAIVHAMRGGIGVMTLAGRAAEDYREIHQKLNDQMAGKSDPTMRAYERTAKNTAFTIGTLKNNLQLLSMDIQQSLGPAVNNAVTWMGGLLRSFRGQSDEAKSAEVRLAAFGATALVIVGGVGTLTVKVLELTSALKAAGLAGLGAKGGLATLFAGLGIWGGAEAVEWSNRREAQQAKDLSETAAFFSRTPADIERNAWNKYFATHKEELNAAQKLANTIGNTWGMGALDAKNKPPAPKPPPFSAGGGMTMDQFMGKMKSGEGAKNQVAEIQRAAQEIQKAILEASGQKRAAADLASKMEYEQTVKDFPKLREQAHKLLIAQLKQHADEEKSALLKKWEYVDEELERQVKSGGNALNELFRQRAKEDERVNDELEKQFAHTGDVFSKMFGPEWTKRLHDSIDEATRTLLGGAETFQADATAYLLGNSIGANVASGIAEAIGNVDAKIGNAKPLRQHLSEMTRLFRQTGDDARNILSSAFEGLILGSKNVFGQILDEFKHLLAHMVAEIAASGIIKGLGSLLGGITGGGGGGGFLGGIFGKNGLGGLLGGLFGGGAGGAAVGAGIGTGLEDVAAAFAFDDGSNDRKALHWGMDFGKLFTAGAQTAMSRHGALSLAGAGGGSVGDIHIHMPGMVVREEADIRKLSAAIANETYLKLRTRVGS